MGGSGINLVVDIVRAHVDELRWTPTSSGGRVEEYTLSSRSGFKHSVEEAARERTDLRLLAVEDVVAAVSGSQA